MKTRRDPPFAAIVVSLVIAVCSPVSATVTLQNATATYSQGGFPVSSAIDGSFSSGLNGWAIDPNEGTPQTAVFETATDIGAAGGSLLTFTLSHLFFDAQHTLGRFRLSVTTDDRSTFADGLSSGGDVTATWIVLDPILLASMNGTTLTELGDNSILASGTSPDTDIYTITALTSLTGITGIRLEALTDPSLPFNGPGREPLNGNFVLTEFEMDITAVPEPATYLAGAFLLLPLAFGAFRKLRQNLAHQ